MNPIKHPSNTRTLAAPQGWDEVLRVEPLGITDQIVEGVPCVWSFWRPDAQELAALNAGGSVVLSIVGRGMPPVAVMVAAPEGPSDPVCPHLGESYEPTMAHSAKPGTRVRFRAGGGYPWQKKAAEEAGFVKDAIYTVRRCDVGRSMTEVIVDELPGRWNSCLFADLDEAKKPPVLVLDACQLRQAAEFAAPDYEREEDQRGTELCFAHRDAGTSIDGEDMPAGMYCWYSEYPEEGALLLDPFDVVQERHAQAANRESKAS